MIGFRPRLSGSEARSFSVFSRAFRSPLLLTLKKAQVLPRVLGKAKAEHRQLLEMHSTKPGCDSSKIQVLSHTQGIAWELTEA